MPRLSLALQLWAGSLRAAVAAKWCGKGVPATLAEGEYLILEVDEKSNLDSVNLSGEALDVGQSIVHCFANREYLTNLSDFIRAHVSWPKQPQSTHVILNEQPPSEAAEQPIAGIPITIDFTDAETLESIIEYVTIHKGVVEQSISRPLVSSNLQGNGVSEEDAIFITSLSVKKLGELLLAANYLGIEQLVELASARIAAIINDKTPEEMREFLGIEDDLTEREKAEIHEEIRWSREF